MNTTTKLEVISLIRMSSAEQAAEGRAGVDRQRGVIVSGAKQQNLRIRREIVAIDVSGRHVKDDPQFQALFAELQDPNLAGVIVSEQSRIFRPENFSDYAILDNFARNKKLVFTPGEVIDPTTAAGRMSLTLNGLISGEELHKIRERCMTGKQVLRLKGGHPGGNQVLPRTVRYVRDVNANGRATGGHFELVPVEAARMKRAFALLIEGDSYVTIAEKIGGGWTANGIRNALANPINIGIRRYKWESFGEEYKPEPTAKHPNPKMRRRVKARVEPLDVPTREELIAGIKPPIVEPIVSIADFDYAQSIIERRYKLIHFRKDKLKATNRGRFIALGTAFCSCGLPLYGRYAGPPKRDAYRCKSLHPKGKGCGARSVLRDDLDAAICATVSHMANAEFILSALDVVLQADSAVDDATRAKCDLAVAKLESGRREMLIMVRRGDMTRDEFLAETKALQQEVSALKSLLPAPAPRVEPAAVAAAIAEVFAEFEFLSRDQKLRLLRGAVREIKVDSHARAITVVTLNGGYLGRGANSLLRCTTQSGISTFPDITFKFPQPIAIPKVNIDGRSLGKGAPQNLMHYKGGTVN